jgi:FkbM family methyltransferase
LKYNFVEIGTCHFETLIESADDNTVGLSIEPLKYYLDLLPNKNNVKKLNCAVSRNNQHEQLEIYYIPASVIEEQNLHHWLRGCNSVGDYHPLHKQLNVTHLVIRESVTCVPIGYLFDQHNITELDYLKIDTEGSDCDILSHFFEYLKDKNVGSYPKCIKFESNENALPEKLKMVKSLFVGLGYRITREDYDTILEFNS